MPDIWTDKLTFVGAGNIAEVLIDRLVNIGSMSPQQLFACDLRAERRALLRKRFVGLLTSEDNREGVRFARWVIVATPPAAVVPALEELLPALTPEHVLISLAASVPLASLEKAVKGVPIVRALVNTPSLVGEGMNLYALGSLVTPEIRWQVSALLDLFGRKFEVSDEQMDFWCALCSAGPTYIFPVIEALADAAIARGISRDQALIGASQVVLGAARLVQQTGRAPADLERMTGLRTLREQEAHQLFTDAYEEAVGKLKGIPAGT